MARTAVTVYPMKGGCTVTGSHLCCHCVKKGNSSAQDFALAAKSVRMCDEQERIRAIPYLVTLDK